TLLQIGIDVRRGSRKTMEFGDVNLPFTARSAYPDDRVERCERDVHVAWIRGDALIALTQNRVNAIESVQGAAAAARIAFVAAGERRIGKVVAARALHQIAADGGGVA